MSGSSIVALIRVMTSPPNGCWRFSIDATATGVPVATSRRVATTVVVPRSKAMAYWVAVVSPGSTSTSASSTTTAVTLKSASRSTFGSRRSTCRSATGSRSSIASSSRSRSGRWSARVGSTSSTYRFWIAGRRITWRPTPTVAALGRVVSGGTSTARSRVALTRQASRQPSSSCSRLNVFTSCRVIGLVPSTRTLHLWQVPWPPQVESIAMPFHDAESKTVTPGGTRTSRCTVRAGSVSSTVNDSDTRPVPSCGAGSAPRVGSRPSRRTASRSTSGRPSRKVMSSRPPSRGGRRSMPSPTRRGRGTRRRP